MTRQLQSFIEVDVQEALSNSPERIPVDVAAVAEACSKFEEAALDPGIEGVCMRQSGITGILVNLECKPETRKRFTIAHEVGHARLPGHGGRTFHCRRADMKGTVKNGFEVQANEYAANLLMPTGVFLSKAEGVCPDRPHWDGISALADAFEVSLMACARRFATTASYPCALVVSDARRVLWHKGSSRFEAHVPARPLSDASQAYYCLRDEVAPEAPEPIAADEWLARNTGGELWEHSRGLPNYDTVLTMLWEE